MMRTIWCKKPSPHTTISTSLAFCSIDQVTARIIRNREVTGEEALQEYLHGSLEDLHDPRQMKDITRAAKLLLEKIQDGVRQRNPVDPGSIRLFFIRHFVMVGNNHCHSQLFGQTEFGKRRTESLK